MARDWMDPLIDRLARARLPRVPALPLAERRLRSPFGAVTLPAFPSLPTSLDIDERRRQVLKYCLGADAASILGFIPYVGQFMSEQVADVHMRQVVDLLSKEDLQHYMKWEERLPTNTLPMLASFGSQRR